MPQSSLFGNHASHPFAQQPEFVNGSGFLKDFPGNNDLYVKNLKRKDNSFDAGNFEIQELDFRPTDQKRARVSKHDEFLPDTTEPKEELKMIEEKSSNLICNSMVTHMTTSFLHHETSEKAVMETDAVGTCESMDVENEEKPEMQTVCDPGYMPADLENIPRKSHFYIYRCKPHYCIFH